MKPYKNMIELAYWLSLLGCFLAVNGQSAFPRDFAWGTATSSYQIEGAWNVAGKGENIWDQFTHATPEKIRDRSNGDVACDHYNKYREDVQLMKTLGVTHYRFSISWARIYPTGKKSGGLNKEGAQFYVNLVNELLKNGITPMVTLYHWDLPQRLQDTGGWENEEIVQDFADYARECFNLLGFKVRLWITFNEPWVTTWIGYGIGVHAPGISSPGTGVYRVAHNILKSHAQAYHIYNNEFRARQLGKIGITYNGPWCVPKNPNNPQDVIAAERALLFEWGWFAHPVFFGDYPHVMKSNILEKSLQQGYNVSRLPIFTDEEKRLLRGSTDFFGINFYTSALVQHAPNNSTANYEADQDLIKSGDPNWNNTGSDWLKVTPFGLREILKWVQLNYNNPEIYVTENGVSDRTGTLTDTQRVNFYKDYIYEMSRAMTEQKVRLRGYFAWSLLDNFEWASGYTEKFGIHRVDFNNTNRPRSVKQSATWYRNYIREWRNNAAFTAVDKMVLFVLSITSALMLYS